MSGTRVLETCAESTTATYPNALWGPWTTRVERMVYGWRPDTEVFVVQAYTDESQYPRVLKSCSTLDEALAALTEQELKVRESGVTAETPRQGRCCYCRDVVDVDRLMMWRSEPFLAHEDNYDGCRGWD